MIVDEMNSEKLQIKLRVTFKELNDVIQYIDYFTKIEEELYHMSIDYVKPGSDLADYNEVLISFNGIWKVYSHIVSYLQSNPFEELPPGVIAKVWLPVKENGDPDWDRFENE